MNDARLERECRVFARYLIGAQPSPYVVERYAEGQRRHPGFGAAGVDDFDRWLTRFAALHPALTQLADGHARLFAPRSVLRKKLVLLLAILESCAPTAARIDAVDPGPRALLPVRLAGRGALSGLAIVVGTLLLLPARGVAALAGGWRSWRR